MIEFAATVTITASSLLLFGYWFRYTCLLILSARTSRDYAGAVAAANELSFPEVQATLATQDVADLEGLKAALDRDYQIVTYLLNHASTPANPGDIVEKRMLRVHYQIMRTWYAVTRSLSPSVACSALDEMASVVAHFANTMGAQTAGAAA